MNVSHHSADKSVASSTSRRWLANASWQGRRGRSKRVRWAATKQPHPYAHRTQADTELNRGWGETERELHGWLIRPVESAFWSPSMNYYIHYTHTYSICYCLSHLTHTHTRISRIHYTHLSIVGIPFNFRHAYCIPLTRIHILTNVQASRPLIKILI